MILCVEKAITSVDKIPKLSFQVFSLLITHNFWLFIFAHTSSLIIELIHYNEYKHILTFQLNIHYKQTEYFKFNPIKLIASISSDIYTIEFHE